VDVHGVHPATTRLQRPQLHGVLAHIVKLDVLALACCTKWMSHIRATPGWQMIIGFLCTQSAGLADGLPLTNMMSRLTEVVVGVPPSAVELQGTIMQACRTQSQVRHADIAQRRADTNMYYYSALINVKVIDRI
jgi:hypothetical protein